MNTERTRARGGVLLGTTAALLAAVAACAAPPWPEVALPDAGGAGCTAGTPAGDGPRRGRAADTLRIAAPGPLEGRRPPVPSSWAERIAYRHLYGTLVEVDCRGRVRPALASSWTSADGGRRWTFRLRRAAAGAAPSRNDGQTTGAGPGARAAGVAAAWRRTGLVAGSLREGGPETGGLAVATEGEELTVALPRPVATPGLFADPRFAVTADGPPPGPPPGTGSHELASTRADGHGGEWVLAPRGGGGPVLRIVGHGGGAAVAGPRPRDLLDRGVDLLVTRRPEARRYAASLPGYGVDPLPWDRTYVLLVPALRGDGGPGDPVGGVRPGGDGEPPRVLRELARDAVRADARASRPPHWWEATCGPDASGASVRSAPRDPAAADRDGPSPATSARLLYPGGDPVAEDIAARLAALSGPWADLEGAGALDSALAAARGAASRLRPVGTPPGRFDAALREGGARAYVLALPRRALAPCRSRDALRGRVPWLAAAGPGALPLVDTRPYLAVRRGVAGLRLDWDGVPRLARPAVPPPGGAP